MTDETAFDRERYDAAYPPGIERHYWNRARAELVAMTVQALGMTGVVLDVGCGPGHVVAHLRALGVTCHGCDTGWASAVAGAEDACHYSATPANLPEPLREAVGTVLLLDVLEHLDDPVDLLAALPQTLPHLRHLVVTVPAAPELWSSYDEYFGHRRRYTAPVLARDITTAGWQVVELRPLFAPLYWPARALAAMGRKRAVRLQAPRGAAFAHWLAARVLVVTAGWGPGTSLIAVASRTASTP